jgi:nucleoside-diphosphate-sugar epimerase
MARYLVTGAAGFIGSWIARALVSQGHQVRGFDNMSSGTASNLAAIVRPIDFRKGDIRNYQDVEAACEMVDGIFHQAAIASVQASIDRPLETNQINHVGTLNVLRAADAQGVRRIVFASSSAVYGNQLRPSLDELMNTQPLSPYGAQKLACEHSLRVAHLVNGLETVSLRYFNVYGPRQNASSPYSGVIAKFARCVASAESQEQPVIYGDGEQSRDFVYIEDVVEANLRAMFAPASLAAGKAFNIANGKSQTINELVNELRAISGKPLEAKHLPDRRGDIRASTADITAASAALGYAPRWTFREGLMRTVAWYREQARREKRGSISVRTAGIKRKVVAPATGVPA